MKHGLEAGWLAVRLDDEASPSLTHTREPRLEARNVLEGFDPGKMQRSALVDIRSAHAALS